MHIYFYRDKKNGIIIFVGLCHQQTFGSVCSAYIFHWLQANTGLKTITTTKSLFISIINSYEVETVIFGIAVIGFGFLSLGDSWEKVCETQMELFLSAERRRQISHSASAVRGNFSGLCCLLMKNALYTTVWDDMMCLELKITTLQPIVGKSPEGIDCSGKTWCVYIWTLHLKKPLTWTTEDFCGRNNQEGLCEWKYKKRPVVIVIRAKDEEEVVDGSTMIHWKTKM